MRSCTHKALDSAMLFPTYSRAERKLNQFRTDFILEGDSEKEFHLPKWSAVTASKKEDGQGVNNLRLQLHSNR